MYENYFNKAKKNERKRANFPVGLKKVGGRRVFMMMDAILPESIIIPHKQNTQGVIERLNCVYGEVFIVFFSNSGEIIKVNYLQGKSNKKVTIPTDIYHTIVAITPAVLKEEMGQTRKRAYDESKDKTYAAWGKVAMKNINDKIRRRFAISLYSESNWEKFLSHFKFWEEPYETVDKMLPKKGKIVELGCGEGLLSNYLAIGKPERKIIGIEIVPERLKLAKKGVKNTTYRVGDVVKTSFSNADCFVLFHVLHHLPGKAAQEKVLVKAKNALNRGGKLVIVDVHVAFTIKFIAAWIADNFLVPWVFEKRFYTRAYFRSEREWMATLKSLGFKVKVSYETAGRPFPNVIFECYNRRI